MLRGAASEGLGGLTRPRARGPRRIYQGLLRPGYTQGPGRGASPHGALEEAVALTPEAWALLNQAANTLGVSARGYHRLLRVARTVADLDGAPQAVARPHMAEALSYRARMGGR